MDIKITSRMEYSSEPRDNKITIHLDDIPVVQIGRVIDGLKEAVINTYAAKMNLLYGWPDDRAFQFITRCCNGEISPGAKL